MPYFGVVLPPPVPVLVDYGNSQGQQLESEQTGSGHGHGVILEDKKEVLKLLKANKTGRFKVFQNKEAAEEYVKEQQEDPRSVKDQLVGNKEKDGKEIPSHSTTPSEGCSFSGLTPQQLKTMKEAVQQEDEVAFTRLVDENPRYLVTTCDTPAVVHSGTRANPLHVAATAGSVRMVRMVLEAVQDPQLLLRMYPDQTQEARNRRLEYLLDMYLNTPNKGNYDTPLHQAAKFGHLDVVKFLAGFSSCDTRKVNRAGRTAAEEACSRLGDGDVDLKRAIQDVLKGQYYIPIIRDADLNVLPFVGDPWCPNSSTTSQNEGDVSNSLTIVSLSPSYSSSSSFHPLCGSPSASSPASNLNLLSTPRPKQNRAQRGHADEGSPLLFASPSSTSSQSQTFNSGNNKFLAYNSMVTMAGSFVGSPSSAHTTPLGSPLMVQALLGPLSPSEAVTVRNEWRSSTSAHDLRMRDPLKGLERAGRQVAKSHGSVLYEYWPFLDAYCDVTSSEGLRLLDSHLHDVAAQLEEEADIDTSQEVDVTVQHAPTSKSVKSPVSQLAEELSAFHISTPIKKDTTEHQRNSDDDNEKELFDSPLSSPPSSEVSYLTAVEGLSDNDESVYVFIYGSEPSVADWQVYEILKEAKFDRDSFPAVYRWKTTMSEWAGGDVSSLRDMRRDDNANSRYPSIRISKLSVPKLIMPDD